MNAKIVSISSGIKTTVTANANQCHFVQPVSSSITAPVGKDKQVEWSIKEKLFFPSIYRFVFEIRCETEEEDQKISPSHFWTTERHNSFEVHRYVVDKRISTEIEVQNSKGLDLFKVKGINPDLSEEMHENNESMPWIPVLI